MNKSIVFVVNDPAYFISHRLPIGIALLEKGCKVYVVAPGACPDVLIQAGFVYYQVEISRKGKNPLTELGIVWSLSKIFKKIKPDLIHLVTIKPYLYGGIAARLARVPAVVSAVAGLGILFSQNSLKAKALRALLYVMYRVAFGHNNQVAIFQNTSDRDLLVNWGVLASIKSTIIRGAGADLEYYPYCNEPIGVPVVSFAGRLLLDKGVSVFVDAARLLQARNTAVEFWLIGSIDPGNANSVTESQLEEWQRTGLVKCLGHRSDIASLFAKSNIVSLPSYYGEGLPKVLIEAAACGRAVITTDHPGCRDAIEPNRTGFLIPIKDADALAEKIEHLINHPDVRRNMGAAGRKLAEREFAIEKIVDEHMKIYQNLLSKRRTLN